MPILALLAVACLDPLGPGRVQDVRVVPGDRKQTVEQGEAFELALQLIDAKGRGTNGVACFFALEDPSQVSFDTAASGESTARILTKHDVAENVKSDGLAVARLHASDEAEPGDTKVWAGLGSDYVAPDASTTVNNVWEFTVHVTGGDAGAGGAP